MGSNKGFFKEDEMVYRLDQKKIKELDHNLYHLMQELFGHLDDDEIITSYRIDGFRKPDFVIIYKGQTRYVSMKSGSSKIVHSEDIKTFILFLRSLGISKRTQQTILLYQFGDKTMDGTGKVRMNYDELRLWLHDRIIEANKELNQRHIIKAVIERCVIVGVKENAIPIDCLYHGDYEFGTVATTKQIMKHIEKGMWDFLQNLHIGPLLMRPHARYVGKEVKDESKRHIIEISWLNLQSDIDFMARRYSNY